MSLKKVSLLVLFNLIFVGAAKSQTNLIVNEAKSNAVLLEKSANILLFLENPNKALASKITLELLDTNGKIRANTVKEAKIKKGSSVYKISLPLGDLMTKAEDEIGWYRLNYKISDSNDNLQTAGIVSFSEIIKDIFELRVSAPESVYAGMKYRARARAVHPFTGEPVKNVKIEGEINITIDTENDDDELKITAKSKTDADGFAILDFKIPAGIKIDYADSLNVTGSKYGLIREVSEDLEEAGDTDYVYLNTDKPIYQPGQVLNVRGIMLKSSPGENSVVTDAELEFSVKDGEDTLLYKETVKTSRFGIASISWRIPENAKLGEYTIRVENEDGDAVGHEEIKVTRYDLPNFTVSAKADRDFYLPENKTAKIPVRADYLFGKPVTKGKARLVEESNRRWDYRNQKWSVSEGKSFEGEADAEGKFIAEIDLSDEHSELQKSTWRRYEDLSFAAYFTDLTTNRTEQRRFDLRLTKEAIHIYFIGETYNQNPNLPLTYYISTFYADGTPASCETEIRGGYENEQGERQIARIKTNSFGAGKLEFVAPRNPDIEKDLNLEIKATDAKGQTGTHDENIDFDTDDQLKIRTEKAIFRNGEAVKAEIFSTKQNGLVYLDLVKDRSVIYSAFLELKNGRAEIKIPFQPGFKGELTIAAYMEVFDEDNEDLDLIKTSRGIIFPAPNNLNLEAKFSDSVYRPNQEASINFSVLSPEKTPQMSALGIVVFDKAIEERARTDAEFGGFRGMFYHFRNLLGYGESFGGLTMKDLNEIDLRKPVSDDLQLAADVLLYDSYYYPNISRSSDYAQARSIFAEYFDRQMAPVETALKIAYTKNYSHPTDDDTLRKILSENRISYDDLRDPWQMNYRAEYEVAASDNIVNIESAGADKKFDTKDDFTVLKMSFAYFLPVGKTIDKAVSEHKRRTGKFIRDRAALRDELELHGVDLDNLKDRWNRPYKIEFGVSGRNFKIVFRSDGADGIYQTDEWNKDDFDVWTSEIDYFAETEKEIQKALSNFTSEKKTFPQSEAEFKEILKANNINFALVRDGSNQNVYLTINSYSRYADKVKIENSAKFGSETIQKTTVEPVTQQIIALKIRSRGADFKEGTEDDFDLATFSGVVSEQSKIDEKPKATVSIATITGAAGAVRGTITDPNGAVVPGASVTATNNETEQEFSAATNEDGVYLIENLPAGKYKISAQAMGFNTTVLSDVPVRAKTVTEANLTLDVGGVSATVDVTSQGVTTIETASTMMGNGRGEGFGSGNGMGDGTGESEKNVSENQIEKSTPRLREYFPETLVWQPELVTDKNGRAELKFKLGDNVTTWKMYAIASDEKGKIGVAEKEVRAFQPFFVDVEPPKFLTTGDEIFLPTQIRNYTEKRQKVDVSMTRGDWFSFLNSERQQIEVAPNASENAVFGFRADAIVKEGRQRVTAIAAKDSDAIEKAITVRPNGQEIVKTESKLFKAEANFDINFPASALPKTPRAEVKIYPNLFSHVAESVEGLLQRPYGCGEQTISSTYPNLMILKFTEEDNKLRQTAQKYLQKGYERLLGYQVADGGFSYWGVKDSADIALTAYAIRFLNEASDFIETDEDVIRRAQDWLIRQQRADGSWTRKYSWENAEDASRTKLFTSYVARTLTMHRRKDESTAKDQARNEALQKALAYLRARNAEIDEPYALALFGLASLDAGNLEDANSAAERLEKMAIAESDRVYWNLETNTPFYGWGTAGRIETTALVVQLFAKLEKINPKSKIQNPKLNAGTMFLLKNKDRYGVWYSTQTTINVLDAFLATLGNAEIKPNSESAPDTIQILLNGEILQNISVSSDQITPIILDLSGKLNAANRLEIKSPAGSPVMSQIVQTHYIDWRDSEISNRNTNESRQIRLDYKCDKSDAEIMQDVTCSVEAERIGFKGYGMLLAEIGLPPGADVSRESLQAAMDADSSLSRYDVLPDRIILYMWSRAGGTRFNFKFRPRYGINAQTPASIVYDYYNEEAKATVAPLKFSVK